MYEAQITDLAQNEAFEDTQLRALRWPELVAKLAAMRDLRLSLARQQGTSSGAFSSFADIREELSHESDSHYLANRNDASARQNLNETDHHINRKTLADRKGPSPKIETPEDDGIQRVPSRDREIR